MRIAVVTCGLGRETAAAALQYVAPVGEVDAFVAGVLDVVEASLAHDEAPVLEA